MNEPAATSDQVERYIAKRIVSERELEIRRELALGRLRVSYRRRPGTMLWGRFGGGWQWALGFRSGGSTLLLQLLVCEVTLSWTTKKKGTPA